MAIEQDFLPFANGGSANVVSQSAYVGLTSLLQNGFSAGVAQSSQLNKVWRQSSIMSAVLAQFIVNTTGQPAIDDGTTATLLANLATAVAVSARQNPVLTDTGTANAYAVANLSAFAAYPSSSGLTIDVSIANANTGASTLNVDGLGAKPIYGLGLQPLQGGELIIKGVACLLYIVASTVNSGNGAWVLTECAGGTQQVSPATQSSHAVNLGQFAASLLSPGYATMPVIVAGVKRTLYFQWGSSAYTGASDSIQTFNFPIAFPNVGLTVTGSIGSILGNNTFGFQLASASQYTVGFHSSSGAAAVGLAYYWTAIGY